MSDSQLARTVRLLVDLFASLGAPHVSLASWLASLLQTWLLLWWHLVSRLVACLVCSGQPSWSVYLGPYICSISCSCCCISCYLPFQATSSNCPTLLKIRRVIQSTKVVSCDRAGSFGDLVSQTQKWCNKVVGKSQEPMFISHRWLVQLLQYQWVDWHVELQMDILTLDRTALIIYLHGWYLLVSTNQIMVNHL